ncbi:hypothetical protein EUA93_10035 [Nocardioides oleivorans]|uniref:Uncharacterized protein n=1 Tax=Nocardioides oleivorans TaxID=273676 RepID=A0A4Q2RZB4_9ACTN|nr:hypothetical protein [Nocardioides oleivorans]RYB94650.1 hypothetical protein EUA93_10035 [Nocardioides oleivorans]
MTDMGNERGAGTSRRTLMRGAAWTVPVVAVAAQAPAFAASPCDPQTYRIDWGVSAYTPPGSLTATPNVGTAVATGSAGGNGINVTFTSTVLVSTRYDSNLTVLPTTGIGNLGAGEQGLAIRSNGSLGAYPLSNQTITVAFGRAVSNLSFTVVDIDRDANFWDRVAFNPAPGAGNFTRAAQVDGAGNLNAETSGDGPFRFTGPTGNLVDTSGAGNVQVRYAGGASFTSFQILYWNTVLSGPQGILLSDFSFTARGC